MRKTALLLTAVLMIASFSAAAPSDRTVKPGLTPDNPFYFTEQVVEGLEVQLAGIIGGKAMKAKAIANNAEERLAEAEKMKSKNKIAEAEKLAEKYQKAMNRSREAAARSDDPDLNARIDEVSNRNTEVLNRVKAKAPQQAQKGLNNAIDASNNTGRGPEKRPDAVPEPAVNNSQGNETLPEPSAGNRSPDTPVNKTVEMPERQENITDDVVKDNSSDSDQNLSDTEKALNQTEDDLNDSTENQTTDSDTVDNTTDTGDSITGDATGTAKAQKDRENSENPLDQTGLN